MNAANHCGFSDFGMARCYVLHLDRGDPLPTRLDDILGAVGNRHKPLGAHCGDVPRLKPTRLGMGVRLVDLEVARTNPGAANLEGTERFAIPR